MSGTKTTKPVIDVFTSAFKAPVSSVRITLADGMETTAHVVKQSRKAVKPKLIVFSEHTSILDWCLNSGIENAIGGGFDLHHSPKLLGEYWVGGELFDHVAMEAPWGAIRGAVYFGQNGHIQIDQRQNLPLQPLGDLLQAGPTLVKEGKNLLSEGVSPEGFSKTAHQFTPDPSVGRHPRSAIGFNDEHYWTVVCDGRTTGEAGLSLYELAEFMKVLGADAALNLDGGSSSQLIRRGRLLNKPWGQQGDFYPEGLPARSAIYFVPC